MSETSHVAFFGDAEHAFDLARPELVRELEILTGAGIGTLVGRVCHTGTFAHADLEHVIRLGLVGGGTDPKAAIRLVATYLPARPLEAAMILAASILGALFFGASREEPPADLPDTNAAATLAGLQENRA